MTDRDLDRAQEAMDRRMPDDPEDEDDFKRRRELERERRIDEIELKRERRSW